MPSVWGEYIARKRQFTEASHEHQVISSDRLVDRCKQIFPTLAILSIFFLQQPN